MRRIAQSAASSFVAVGGAMWPVSEASIPGRAARAEAVIERIPVLKIETAQPDSKP